MEVEGLPFLLCKSGGGKGEGLFGVIILGICSKQLQKKNESFMIRNSIICVHYLRSIIFLYSLVGFKTQIWRMKMIKGRGFSLKVASFLKSFAVSWRTRRTTNLVPDPWTCCVRNSCVLLIQLGRESRKGVPDSLPCWFTVLSGLLFCSSKRSPVFPSSGFSEKLVFRLIWCSKPLTNRKTGRFVAYVFEFLLEWKSFCTRIWKRLLLFISYRRSGHLLPKAGMW